MVMAHMLSPPKYRSEVLIAVFPVHKEQKRSSKCLVYTLASFVALCALCLAFASIVLRVQDPKVKIISVKVMHFSYYSSTSPPSLSSSSSSPSFNVTIVASVMISNPNFGQFSYENSTVKVMYGIVSVGAWEIGEGRVDARKNREINVMVNIRSSKQLFIGGNINKDIDSGLLKLRSYAELSGRVQVLKTVNKRKTIEMACIMNLNLTSHSVHHIQC